MVENIDTTRPRRGNLPGHEITNLLVSWNSGNEQALEQLMPLVYGRLRRLAAGFLRHERSDHTLETAALVNEAFLKLLDQGQVEWQSQAHFFAISGKLMRRILVDHARRQSYAKRGGNAEHVSADLLERVAVRRPAELIVLDEALNALTDKDEELVRLVELRYFGGFTKEETARILGTSPATVTRRMRMAKAWLHHYLSSGEAIQA